MGKGKSEIFLTASDELGRFINQQAERLYITLKKPIAKPTTGEDSYTDYFTRHHLGHRLFFSIQNSAHILYEAVKRSGKPLNEIRAIDYGAGLGTLFLLGGLLGFRRFDYNDHLAEWQATAQQACMHTGSQVSDYVIGDVDAVTKYAERNGFTYDLILSRNVLEHVYSLSDFYNTLYRHNPKAVVYGSTTANYHNLLMRLYHYHIHAQAERSHYFNQRRKEIAASDNSLSPKKCATLARQTRGYAGADFSRAIEFLKAGKTPVPDPTLRSNTCDHITGVWCEHLLTRKEYEQIITEAGFRMDYTAGFWDTHYPNGLMNHCARMLNGIINRLGLRKAVVLSPFVNIVAY